MKRDFKKTKKFVIEAAKGHWNYDISRILAYSFAIVMVLSGFIDGRFLFLGAKSYLAKLVVIPCFLMLFPLVGLYYIEPFQFYKENKEKKSFYESLRYFPIDFKDIQKIKLINLVKLYGIIAALALFSQTWFGFLTEWWRLFYVLILYFLYPLVVSGGITLLYDAATIKKKKLIEKLSIGKIVGMISTILFFSWLVFASFYAPLSKGLSVEAIKEQMQWEYCDLVFPYGGSNQFHMGNGMGIPGENFVTYPSRSYNYRVEATEELIECFHFDLWEPNAKEPIVNPIIKLDMERKWDILLYEDGSISVHYRKAEINTREWTVYSVPPYVIQEVKAYLKEHSRIEDGVHIWDDVWREKCMNLEPEQMISVNRYIDGKEEISGSEDTDFADICLEVAEKTPSAKRVENGIETELTKYEAESYLEYSALSGHEVYIVEVSEDAQIMYGHYIQKEGEDAFMCFIPDLAYYGIGVRGEDGSISYYTYTIPVLFEAYW